MWRFVNLYLVLFLVDGVISLTDVIVARFLGGNSLFILRGIVAFLPFIFSFPLYFMLGSIAGFPKRIILPMIIFQVWCGLFFALPIPIFLGIQDTKLWLSVAQPCLAIAALIYLRYKTKEKTWLYKKADFSHLVFQWKRLFAFVTTNVIVVFPLLTIYLAACISLAVSDLSRGFIRLDLNGISIETRAYTHQGHNLYLLPTFHVAEPEYFRILIESLPEASTAVILEGVTDKKRLLRHRLKYDQIAQSLGLEAQDNRMFSTGYVVKRCDVDTSSFSPQTLDILNKIGSAIHRWSSGNRLMVLAECVLLPSLDPKLLWQDLIELRNRRVVDCMRHCLKEHDNVLVPWGAAHMPGLEREILKWGLTESNRKQIRVLNWGAQKKGFPTR
ncbi:MAG: hypothetical protein ACQ9MH_24945 [Nitrospinales bacterium]